jgi:hypothetical protein
MADLSKIIISDMASHDNNQQIIAALRSPDCKLTDDFMVKFQRQCILFYEDEATFITFKFRAFPTEQQNRQVLSFVKSYFETELNMYPFVEFWHLFSCLAEKLFPDKFQQHDETGEVCTARLDPTAAVNHQAVDQTSDSAISLSYKVNSWLEKCSNSDEKAAVENADENVATAETQASVSNVSSESSHSPPHANAKTVEEQPQESDLMLADVSLITHNNYIIRGFSPSFQKLTYIL